MGKTEDNLLVNGVSVDDSKYNELVGPHSSYRLQIASFEASDLDVYGCSYGHLRTTINLTLNENDYECTCLTLLHKLKYSNAWRFIHLNIIVL